MNGQKDSKVISDCLARYRNGWIAQSARFFIVALVLIVAPLVLYVRIATFTITGLPEAAALLIYVFAFGLIPAQGLFALFFGLLSLCTGLAYVKLAQNMVLEVAPKAISLDLSYRKEKKILFGSTLCIGIIIYADQRQEQINLLARDMDVSSLIGRKSDAKLYGTPFNLGARVISTSCGELVEQPLLSWVSVWNLLISKIASPINRRLFGQFVQIFVDVLLLYYLWFLWSSQYDMHRFLAVIYLLFAVGILVTIMRIIESWQISRQMKSSNPIPCAVTINKPTGLFANTAVVKAKFICSGSNEKEEKFETTGVDKALCGQNLQALAYTNQEGEVVSILATAGANFALWKSRLRSFLYLPIIIYIISLPFVFQSINSASAGKQETIACSNAQQYYDLGLLYKAKGWTEKARAALLKAATMDSGKTGQKALHYLHSHIPIHSVSEEAEQLNIQGYNLMYRHGDEAKKIFEEAIAKYPEFEWPYSNLGALYLSKGNPTKAVELLQKALAINPEYTNALRHMVDAQLVLGNKQAAKHYLQKASDTDPDNMVLKINYKLQSLAIDCSI